MRRKRGKEGEEGSGSTWMVTFSSFILILLAFFIMLSSYATMEGSKITQFVRSFNRAVSFLTGGLKFEPDRDILMLSPDIMDNKDILPALKRIVKGLKLESGVGFSVTGRGLVMTVADTVLFDLGVAEISPEAFPLLSKIASVISKTSFPIRIEGHTDNLPIHTEEFPSNWELSTARAVNVLRYFVEKEKIPPERLSAVGYGEFRPLFPNDTPEHRARNRRVEIIFVGAGRDLILGLQKNNE